MTNRLLPLLVLAGACTAPVDEPPAGDVLLDPTITASEDMGTVATVEVATPDAAVARVEISEPGGRVRTFPAVSGEDGTSHTVPLVGLPAATELTWRVVATLEDGTELASDPAVFATAPPPLWLPALTVSVPAADPSAPGFVLTTIIGESPAAAIFDRQGRYVWWWRAEEGAMPCQARVARNGDSILLMTVDQQMTDDIAALVRVGFDGAVRGSHRLPVAHHDFVELPDGSVGYLAFDIRPFDGIEYVGDMLVLLDAATGTEEKVWSTWDHLVPTDAEVDTFYPFGHDWTHGNGLAHDDATGDWFVSLHNVDTIVRLTETGELVWKLGGPENDFALTSGDGFSRQHSPVLIDGGLLLFDNQSPNPDELYSRAVEYRLDEEAMTYAQAWSFDGDQGLFSAYMGSVERRPDGSTLVGWGSGGRITEVSPDGEVAWQIEAAIGSPFGFTHPVETLGEVVE